MIALRSPNLAAKEPKMGSPTPQARFWIAMARENSALSQPKFSAIGIWKTPKLFRTEKPVSRIRHPEMSTGVNSLVDLSFKVFRGSGLTQNSRIGSFQVFLIRDLDHLRDRSVSSETRSASRRAKTPPTIIKAAAKSISQCMGSP